MKNGNGKQTTFDMKTVEQGKYGVKFHGGMWAWTAHRTADDRTAGELSGSKQAAEKAALKFLGVERGEA